MFPVASWILFHLASEKFNIPWFCHVTSLHLHLSPKLIMNANKMLKRKDLNRTGSSDETMTCQEVASIFIMSTFLTERTGAQKINLSTYFTFLIFFPIIMS